MIRYSRPKKCSPKSHVLERAEKFIIEATFLLYTVACVYYSPSMPMYTDVRNTLQQRLVHACNQIQTIRGRMAQLASAYNEFIDLRKQLDAHTEQVNNLKGIFGPGYVDAMYADKTDIVGETSEITPSWKEMRDGMPLWIALREYLGAAGEAKVGEAEEFLTWVEFPNVRRQSIESALRRHPETFVIRKSGKEKYISLRE